MRQKQSPDTPPAFLLTVYAALWPHNSRPFLAQRSSGSNSTVSPIVLTGRAIVNFTSKPVIAELGPSQSQPGL